MSARIGSAGAAREQAKQSRSGSERAGLDKYGGLVEVTSPKGAMGYFRVEKMGNRWVFITPDGHPFWMLGVFDVVFDNRYFDARAKYDSTNPTAVWGIQATKRLTSWGFNTLAEYSSAYVFPSSPGVVRMPFMVMVRPSSSYGLTNNGRYAPQAFKDLMEAHNRTFTQNYANLPDVFDPNFTAYVNGYIPVQISNPFWGGLSTSAWAIGITIDETDDLPGFGPGPEVPAPRDHPHPGYTVITAMPSLASSAKWSQTYSDTKVYAKYELQAELKAKYGTIAALNAAWGSNYTTWDSAGGYGAGTGWLDEDGRHTAWLGNTDGTVLAGDAAPAVIADLDTFLYRYAVKYFSVTTAAVRKAAPKQLVFSPASLNGWGGLTRKPILQAAGQYCDVLNASAGSQTVLDKTFQYAGDKPLVPWEGYVANPDSDMSAFPPHALENSVSLQLTFKTQQERGQHYAQRVNFLLDGATSGSGVHTVVGLKFWGWVDSKGEGLNWGLVSLKDNAYDGKEAVIAPGKDPWGYRTGGEERNYGDFVSWAKTANRKAVSDFCKKLQASTPRAAEPTSNPKPEGSDRKGKPNPQISCSDPF